MTFVDLDDFAESNNCLPLLRDVRRDIPQFKVTLFTIPGRCSPGFIPDLIANEGEWLDFVPHGWMHETNRECERWSFGDMVEAVTRYRATGFETRGFKAPGWIISDGCYLGLLARDYWVADMAYNDTRRPTGMKAYILDSPRKIHGHVGHLNGRNANELSLIVPEILKHRDQPFGLARDALR